MDREGTAAGQEGKSVVTNFQLTVGDTDPSRRPLDIVRRRLLGAGAGHAPAGPNRPEHLQFRFGVTKGPGSRAAGLAMAFKLIESAQAGWRAVNAPHLVALVRAGAKFEKGVMVERPTRYASLMRWGALIVDRLDCHARQAGPQARRRT